MRTITIKGKGKSVKEPDLVIIKISISIFKEKFDDALDSMNKLVNNLKLSLKNIGYDETDLKTISYYIEPEFDSVEKGIINKQYSDKFTGFEIMHDLKLEFDYTNDKLSEVFNCLKDYDEEIEFELSFSVKDKKNMIKEVLINATQNAKFNAEILAEASSLKLGDLLKINCNLVDFYFESDTEFEYEENSAGLGSLFSSANITPEDIEISDTITFVWELI